LRTARIRLVLETGERYFFNGATIEGAPDYPEAFLRRYLAFKPGEAFSYGGLGETQLNFTWDALKAAQETLNGLNDFTAKLAWLIEQMKNGVKPKNKSNF